MAMHQVQNGEPMFNELYNINDSTEMGTSIWATSSTSFENSFMFQSEKGRKQIETHLMYDGKYYSVMFSNNNSGKSADTEVPSFEASSSENISLGEGINVSTSHRMQSDKEWAVDAATLMT